MSAICKHLRLTLEAAPSPDSRTDPVFDVAERQLVMLGELAELAMGLSRGFAASAAASAKAEEAILADKFFMPEIGRARACGAKDAADSFQKVSRAVRLTLMLEMKVAETVRDLRAGIVTRTTTPKSAGETPAVLEIGLNQSLPGPSSRAPAGSRPDKRDTDVTRADRDTERLDIEYPERLPKGSYCGLVDDLAADIGATVDWESATVVAPRLDEILPPPRDPLAVTPREMALSP